MNLVTKTLLIALLLLTESCDSTKAVSDDQKETKTMTEDKISHEQYLSEGYSMGLVKYLKDSECPYIIIDEKTKAQFDPINFDEAKFVEYKNDQSKVYYKYRPLRRMNRCNEAQPIALDDIKKRED